MPMYLGLPDRASRATLYSPTTSAVPFQIYVAGSAQSVTAFGMYNPATGVTTAQSTHLIDVASTASGTYYSYLGDSLTAAMTNGQGYHMRLELSGGGVYYSQKICATSAFDATLFGLTVTSCTQPNSSTYTINLSSSIPAGAGYTILVSDNNSAQTAYHTSKTFSIANGFGTAVLGAMSFNITITATLALPNGGSITTQRRWRIQFATSAACSYTLSALSTTSTADETLHVLTVTNGGTDKPGYNILHQTGFEHKLYLVAFDELPQVIREENYATSSAGSTVFQGAAVRTAYSLSFWPCPDDVLTGLQSQAVSSGINIAAIAGTSATAQKMTITPLAVNNEQVPGATILFELDAARVDRCETDLTLV